LVLPEIYFLRPEAALSTHTTRMEINCAIDDSIDNSESLEMNPPWPEVLYHKSKKDVDRLRQVKGAFGWSTTSRRSIWIAYCKSEENLDRLLQIGEGPANIYRMVSIPADYLDFINNAIPSPNGHHVLMAPQSW
jgi:hypothetical protein